MPARPNVLLVMTDDQGYGDFGVQGNPVLETPRLDAFARECPQFERFYVCPVCAPTRASLMTGRYHYRTRVVDTYRGRAMMETDEVTVAEMLGAEGYRTGIFGKWHLGDAHPLRPIDQGFDHSLVHRGGGLAQPSEPPENARRYTDALLERNGRTVSTKGYCTDVYVDEALEFIDASLERGEPFFAYVATNAPHGPFHDVPEALYRKYEGADLSAVRAENGTPPERLARTFAMIENIDQNFGRLLDRLEERGVADDTIVVFLVDNGPVAGRWNAGLRAGKGSVYEGGIRSPLWVRWPARLSPETVVDALGAHIDVLPTLLDAAGAAAPAGVRLDGRSLLPLLEGRDATGPERRVIIQAHRGNVPERYHHCAVVGERWKLVNASGFGRVTADGPPRWQLFDLSSDPGETQDLSEQQPERVAAMRAAYDRWFTDVSSTRPDNYDPPRIRPGTAHEPSTTLTRQDWRSDGPESWGSQGRWELHFERPTELEVTLLFREERQIDTVHLALGDELLERPVSASGTIVPLGSIPFPTGDVDLRVECRSGEDLFDAYQVRLTLPR